MTTTPTFEIIDDIIYDEQVPIETATAGDADDDVTNFSSGLSTALSGLTGLTFHSGGADFPQYAQDPISEFLNTDQQLTDLRLTSSSGGALFSLGTGVATDIKVLDADGSTLNTVFLYAYSSDGTAAHIDPNIVIGRIGDGTTEVDNGDVAFVLLLNESKDTGGVITGANLGIAVYAPLYHDGVTGAVPASIDDFDVYDLANLVYLTGDYTTTSLVPFDNFAKVPSGQDQFAALSSTDPNNTSNLDLLITGFAGNTVGTVNVSTTGLGANAQHVDPGESLRFDFVANLTLPASSNDTNFVHDASHIDYDNHVDAISASFGITQLNPTNTPATVSVFAYEDNGTTQYTNYDYQGSAFPTNAITDPGSPINIEIGDVKIGILDANGNFVDQTAAYLLNNPNGITKEGYGVQITGLLVGQQVQITPDSEFDRFVVTNNWSGKGPSTFDIGKIHVTTVEGGSDTTSTELGSHLIFEDDGPSITAVASATASVVHDESSGLQNATATPAVAGDANDNDVAGSTIISGSTTVASLFTGVGLTEIGFARSVNPLVTVSTSDPGVDGAASQPLSYALSASDGTYSGVSTTGGTQIFMYNGSGATAGLILGRVGTEGGATDAPNENGAIAFALKADSATGEVFVAQYASLFHPTAGSTPAAYDDSINLASGALQMSVTLTDKDGDTATDSGNNIGLLVKFEDDGPKMNDSSGDPNDLVVVNKVFNPADSTTAGARDSSSYGLVPGADGQKSYTIVANDGTHTADSIGPFKWTYDATTGANAFTSITGTYTYTVGSTTTTINLYNLSLNSNGTYTFTMLGTLPSTDVPLSSTIIHAGGPTNAIDVAAKAPSLDYAHIVGSGAVNASHGFVGVNNGNLDGGESLTFSLFDSKGTASVADDTQIDFSSLLIGTKSAGTSHYNYTLHMSDNSTVTVNNVEVFKGQAITVNDPNPNDTVLIESVQVFKVDGNALKIGLGDIHFTVPPSDVQLAFNVALADGDNDVAIKSFTVGIDADGVAGIDSTITTSSLTASTLSDSSAFSAIESLHHQEFADPHDAFAV